MNQSSTRDFLIALSRLPFLTPSRARLLLEYFDPIDSVRNTSIASLEGLLSVTPGEAAEVRNPLQDEKAREAIAKLSADVITLVDHDYPPLLREIIDPPLAIHVRGDRACFDAPAVAVVGSRRASPYAINVARELARQLAESGIVVVSGLARGVDTAAHVAALDAGGKTIAVLGTGIDVVYPRTNGRLTERIASEGLLLTEFPPGSAPKAEHFPIRNRVISGLSLGTIIVEATARSGSLITARMAAEQGREVFAVPGSIFAPGSEGTHRLIQYGAKLVHDIQDVFDEIPGNFVRVEKRVEEPDEMLRDVLTALTRDEGTHIDAISSRVGKTAPAIAESLLQLELGGWIQSLPGARYVRVK